MVVPDKQLQMQEYIYIQIIFWLDFNYDNFRFRLCIFGSKANRKWKNDQISNCVSLKYSMLPSWFDLAQKGCAIKSEFDVESSFVGSNSFVIFVLPDEAAQSRKCILDPSENIIIFESQMQKIFTLSKMNSK